MTITISTELLDSDTRAEMARLLREKACGHELAARELHKQAEALNPLPPPTGGVPAPNGKRGRKAKEPTKSSVAKAGNIEPTLGQVAEALKDMGTARVGAIVNAYGYNRAKTLVLLKELLSDERVELSGKTWKWVNAVGPDEPESVSEPETDLYGENVL